ncbi:MAG: nicotinate-nucleotide adenylyltransferase, partial [Bacillota bacterium]|nr:nicotinate-nucleotide adenylyltransferase [Bacillota bacterium]
GMKMKIGILGGSFDPIHVGHLLLAEQARESAELDRVVFIPTYVSPFKVGAVAASGEDRFRMTELAAEGNPYFEVSDIELKAAEVSYTVHTMEQCEALYGPEAELFLITGTDAFLDMDRWYRAEELFRRYAILVGNRPGKREMELMEAMWRFKEKYGCRARRIDMPRQDISSTDIRRRAAEGKSVKYLVPAGVEEYILRNRLYST